jgi:hypothetical protein
MCDNGCGTGYRLHQHQRGPTARPSSQDRRFGPRGADTSRVNPDWTPAVRRLDTFCRPGGSPIPASHSRSEGWLRGGVVEMVRTLQTGTGDNKPGKCVPLVPTRFQGCGPSCPPQRGPARCTDGHAGSSVGQTYGAKDMVRRFGLETLADAVNKIKYPGLDLSRVPSSPLSVTSC